MVHSTHCNAREKTPKDLHAALLSKSRKVTDQLSEQDIIELQDQFLTNGFHYITVETIEQGRKVIDTFLSSLNYYQDVGYLSLANQQTVNDAENIYRQLKADGCFESMRYDEFFIERWHYDFMWIEAIEPLWHLSWFKKLYQQLVDGSFEESLPIFIVLYTNPHF